MKISYGKGKTKYGPGVQIDLSGEEVAQAIAAYLVAHDINISGPRTIKVNDQLCEKGYIYVDPSGFVIENGVKFSGRGENQEEIRLDTLPPNTKELADEHARNTKVKLINKEDQLIFYLIERSDTQEWFFIEQQWKLGSFFDKKEGRYDTVKGWTKDPMKAMRFDTEKGAEDHLKVRSELKDLPCVITEHEFVREPTSQDESHFKTAKEGMPNISGNTTGNQTLKTDNDYHGGYHE